MTLPSHTQPIESLDFARDNDGLTMVAVQRRPSYIPSHALLTAIIDNAIRCLDGNVPKTIGAIGSPDWLKARIEALDWFTCESWHGSGAGFADTCFYLGLNPDGVRRGIKRSLDAAREVAAQYRDKLCKEYECALPMYAQGFCKYHHKLLGVCVIDGCTNRVCSLGRCYRHYKTCKHPGCGKWSQIGGYCVRHSENGDGHDIP